MPFASLVSSLWLAIWLINLELHKGVNRHSLGRCFLLRIAVGSTPIQLGTAFSSQHQFRFQTIQLFWNYQKWKESPAIKHFKPTFYEEVLYRCCLISTVYTFKKCLLAGFVHKLLSDMWWLPGQETRLLWFVFAKQSNLPRNQIPLLLFTTLHLMFKLENSLKMELLWHSLRRIVKNSDVFSLVWWIAKRRQEMKL